MIPPESSPLSNFRGALLGASSSICYPPFLRAEAQSGSSANQFTVPNGQLTFDSEGLECPNLSDKCKLYHSRIPHVPSEQSGVTIGRGYDLKRKEPDKIKKERFDCCWIKQSNR